MLTEGGGFLGPSPPAARFEGGIPTGGPGGLPAFGAPEGGGFLARLATSGGGGLKQTPANTVGTTWTQQTHECKKTKRTLQVFQEAFDSLLQIYLLFIMTLFDRSTPDCLLLILIDFQIGIFIWDYANIPPR
jgi:hypothetical protein